MSLKSALTSMAKPSCENPVLMAHIKHTISCYESKRDHACRNRNYLQHLQRSRFNGVDVTPTAVFSANSDEELKKAVLFLQTTDGIDMVKRQINHQTRSKCSFASPKDDNSHWHSIESIRPATQNPLGLQDVEVVMVARDGGQRFGTHDVARHEVLEPGGGPPGDDPPGDDPDRGGGPPEDDPPSYDTPLQAARTGIWERLALPAAALSITFGGTSMGVSSAALAGAGGVALLSAAVTPVGLAVITGIGAVLVVAGGIVCIVYLVKKYNQYKARMLGQFLQDAVNTCDQEIAECDRILRNLLREQCYLCEQRIINIAFNCPEYHAVACLYCVQQFQVPGEPRAGCCLVCEELLPAQRPFLTAQVLEEDRVASEQMRANALANLQRIRRLM